MSAVLVTADALERGLDRLAIEIEAFGERGSPLLPLYRRLEDELRQIEEGETTLDAVRARLLKRSQDRTAGRSGASRFSSSRG